MVKFFKFMTKGGKEGGIEVITKVENIHLKGNHTSEYKGTNNEWTIYAQKNTPESGYVGYYVSKEEVERVEGLLIGCNDKGSVLERFE